MKTAGKRVALTSTVLSLVSAAILYLFGSFSAASFNISEWDTIGRVLIAALWLVATIGATGSVFALEMDHR